MIFGKTSPRTVPDVKYSHSFSKFIDVIDDAVNMRFSPLQQMPQVVPFRCDSAPIGIFFETIDCFF